MTKLPITAAKYAAT